MKEEHRSRAQDDSPHSDAAEAAEKLVADFRALLSHIEELLGAGVDASGATAAQARETLLAQVHQLRDRVMQAEAYAVDRSKQAAAAADRYVHDAPWKAIALALVAGLVIGLVVGRRD